MQPVDIYLILLTSVKRQMNLLPTTEVFALVFSIMSISTFIFYHNMMRWLVNFITLCAITVWMRTRNDFFAITITWQ